MGRIGMLGLCSFGSPCSLGGCGTLWPQSVVASKVDLVRFLQCKQLVVKFSLQCGCRVSFKYFAGLFVVNKRVHFVPVVCLVHKNSHPSLSAGSMTMMFSSVFSRLRAFCSSGVKLLFGNEAYCKVEVSLLLMISLVDSDSSCWRDSTASTLDTIASVGICLGVTECLSP